MKWDEYVTRATTNKKRNISMQ